MRAKKHTRFGFTIGFSLQQHMELELAAKAMNMSTLEFIEVVLTTAIAIALEGPEVKP